jgi:hypothetical protein
MTVRAEKVALRGFGEQPPETSAELPEAEFLCGWVAMMELQHVGAGGVAAIDTSAAVRGDKVELSLSAALAERSAELLATPGAPRLDPLGCSSYADRDFRGVVFAEWRALEAEASSVQRTHLPVENHLRREQSPAGEANE